MNTIQAIIIAIVEGLTEFLPVSSTGHMIITEKFLGVSEGDAFVHAFTFIIQFGAILSVVCLYWKNFFQVRNQEDFKEKKKFYTLLIVGVLPAVVIGMLAKKSGLLDWLLDSVLVVAIMLVVGGIFMLFCDKIFNKGKEENEVTWKRALKIGFFQCISVIPGVSRSMATIVGGMQQKLTRKKAAEFSFFLAVPTMAGATLLDIIEMFGEDTTWATSSNILILLIGCAVAFVVALLAMKWFVSFLTKYGFKAFGFYRIIIGAALLIMMACGISFNFAG
ncbi:MAG: undecaprenyl-diphosphate phosphatase [Bacteroidales bacterium]|nr:undecaprenyl-diphosphate phosphatase [Bacteroidales bacterium]